MLFYLFLVFYCSSPTEVGEIVVESSVIAKVLLVENNLSQDIYYLVDNQGCGALILAPRFGESNLIKAFRKKSIPFKDIPCGSHLENNDIIVFQWWTKDFKDFSDVKTITITL